MSGWPGPSTRMSSVSSASNSVRADRAAVAGPVDLRAHQHSVDTLPAAVNARVT